MFKDWYRRMNERKEVIEFDGSWGMTSKEIEDYWVKIEKNLSLKIDRDDTIAKALFKVALELSERVKYNKPSPPR